MVKYYEQPKTAYGEYLKFRAWELVESFSTDKFPIVYSDGFIGGSFDSNVQIHYGDLNYYSDLQPTRDVWGVSATRQHLKKPHRVVTVICNTLEEARSLFDLLVEECKANVPLTKKDVWRPINK